MRSVGVQARMPRHQDGCEVVNTVADRIRAEFLRRIGLGDLLTPRIPVLS